MKRVIVIGCPGSGKSTFARALQTATRLPLYYLDMMNWNADGTNVPKTVFNERLQQTLEEEAWIIDGNYSRTMELRMQYCDTVFFLDYPLEVCIDGIRSRTGRKRPDMPCVLPEDKDDEFLEFIRGYNTDSRPVVLELLQKYSHKDIFIFKNRTEADEFLARLT